MMRNLAEVAQPKVGQQATARERNAALIKGYMERDQGYVCDTSKLSQLSGSELGKLARLVTTIAGNPEGLHYHRAVNDFIERMGATGVCSKLPKKHNCRFGAHKPDGKRSLLTRVH